MTVIGQPHVTPIFPPLAFPFGTSTNRAITGSLRKLSLMCPSTHVEEMGCIECEPLLSHAKSQPKS